MSLPRLLSSPSVSTDRQRLDAPSAQLSSDVRAMVERARAEGYAAGQAAGHTAGMAEAADGARGAAERAVAALRDLVEEEVARLREASGVHDAGAIELATQIAAYVVDAVDTTAVVEVTRRIRAALEQIDDSKVVAHVHPAQVDDLSAALAGAEVRVVAAHDVAGGDVRLVGRWSVADLSLGQRWSAVRELLDASA